MPSDDAGKVVTWLQSCVPAEYLRDHAAAADTADKPCGWSHTATVARTEPQMHRYCAAPQANACMIDERSCSAAMHGPEIDIDMTLTGLMQRPLSSNG